MSELLCDDAFDSTSDRPVKNSVITAWKDTVPLDSALVHKTGNETIDGQKTLAKPLTIISGGTAMAINNPSSYETAGSRDVITFSGAGTEEARIFRYAISGRNGIYIRQTVPGGSGNGQIGVVALSNGNSYVEVPTYTADNNANLIAVNRAMLAQTPTIVHTTGNETIAGEKTFTGILTLSSSEPNEICRTSKTYAQNGIKHKIQVLSPSDGVDTVIGQWMTQTINGRNETVLSVGRVDGTSTDWLGVRSYSDHMRVEVTRTYYPVDGSGNPQALTANALMTSGNVAVDPRIVHTIGNETVAGVKTFANGFDGYPTGWVKVSGGSTVGQYNVFARISANDLGRLIYFEVAQSSNRIPAHGCFIVRAYRTSPVPIWSWRSAHSATDSPIKDGSLYVLVKNDVIYLAWKRQFQYGGLMVRVYLDTLNGNVQSTTSSVVAFSGEGIGVIDNLDGYTVYEVTE